MMEVCPEPDAGLFQAVSFPHHNFGPGLMLSALLHCACIFGLPPLMDFLPNPQADALMRMRVEMRPLRIQIPDRLYLPPVEPDQRRLTEPQPAPKANQTAPGPAKIEMPAPEAPLAEAVRAAPRQFKLPQRVRKVDADQTLIQPRLPPDLPLASQVRLPQLVLLSAPSLPRPAPRRFVEPGRSSAPSVAPRIDAPPQLAAPGNPDPQLRIANMLAGPENALLRLPRPTTPVKVFQAPAPLPTGRGASVSPILGEPIDILALSANPAPLQDKVTIPLGNQIGRLADLPAYEGGAGGDRAATGDMAEFAKALAALPLRYSTPVRIEHPVNASYDLVVTQSGTDQVVPESAGALSGQPVYTVYLQVGAPRAWILQYCVPKEVVAAPSAAAGAVVTIGSAPPTLKAPFPLLTILPPAAMLPRNGYIIVHGFVDTSGQLKDLAVVRAPNKNIKDLILPDLGKWRFRPAVRDGAPVAVEIVLAIPQQQV
jgi:hypothetical protein